MPSRRLVQIRRFPPHVVLSPHPTTAEGGVLHPAEQVRRQERSHGRPRRVVLLREEIRGLDERDREQLVGLEVEEVPSATPPCDHQAEEAEVVGWIAGMAEIGG